ncbi:MAG: transposase [Aestuariivita sp.]|nr:transposase [Aestuariivita sp.]
MNGLAEQSFATPVQQLVFQEYVDACCETTRRVADLDDQTRAAAASWSLTPMVEALVSLRGLDVLSAVTVLAELGDITRFDHPRQLMSFLGLVPSENSSVAPVPSPKPATDMFGASWWKPLGTIAFPRARHAISTRRQSRSGTGADPCLAGTKASL